jgi:hypothetical protein
VIDAGYGPTAFRDWNALFGECSFDVRADAVIGGFHMPLLASLSNMTEKTPPNLPTQTGEPVYVVNQVKVGVVAAGVAIGMAVWTIVQAVLLALFGL